jgi:serine/threonine protein phosphatase PrpC
MVKTPAISGYYEYNTECIGTSRDGFQVVKTWGTGLNHNQAVFNARKNAVDDIIFKGIRDGKGGCQVSPLVSNPNLKRDHQAYFNDFYASNGAFQDFVTDPTGRWIDRALKENPLSDGNTAYEVLVEVDVRGLRAFLINQNFIQ